MDGKNGKNDDYVICHVSDTVFKKTSTISGGGTNPSWNGGQGEELLFEEDAAHIGGHIRLECMDDDSDQVVKKTVEVKADDFIGAAELHFDNAPVKTMNFVLKTRNSVSKTRNLYSN